jgi:hypothetical protein
MASSKLAATESHIHSRRRQRTDHRFAPNRHRRTVPQRLMRAMVEKGLHRIQKFV